MSNHTAHTVQIKKSYFGLAALVMAVASGLFLAAYFAVSQLDVTPETFSLLNNWTTFGYCLTVPVTFILGVLGYRGVHDSRRLALIALGIAVVPFLFIFSQFVWSFLK
ncbi:MAG: hypothetical protein AB1649_03775 [Chloroflexota bacterium]